MATEADILVIFGITGDLARKMTFRALYRLEARGELDCRDRRRRDDDWDDEELREHAREAIAATVETPTRRSSPGSRSGSPTSRATTTTPTTFERLGRGDRRGEQAGLLPRDPAVAVRDGRRAASATAGLTENARVVIEKPFGHDLESARALNAELREVLDEEQILRIDHFLGKEPVMDITYLRFANAILEPVWNRQLRRLRADDDGRGLRGRGPRPLLRPGRGAARRGPEPPPAGAGAGRDGAAVGRRRRPRRDPRRRSWTCSGRCPTADPSRYVRGQYDGYRDVEGVAAGLDDRDLRRARARDRQLALERRPVLHPRRQGDAGRGDRGPGRLQAPAAARDRRPA